MVEGSEGGEFETGYFGGGCGGMVGGVVGEGAVGGVFCVAAWEMVS